MTWNTVCYKIPIKPKANTISSRKCNITEFGPRLHNSLHKYPRDIESFKTEIFKFEFKNFLELIPDEPKMPNYVTAARSNSILDQLSRRRAHGIYEGGWWSP